MIETLEELSKVLNEKKLDGFVKEAASCKDAAAVTALLKTKGIEVSDDCAAKCYEMINKAEELSDEELAKTAGGGQITVNNFTCPYCGGNKEITNEATGQKQTVFMGKLVQREGHFDCSQHFYWDYQCPACGEYVYYYVNDGYWVD